MPRKPWELPFLAEPSEVAALRRVLGVHLRLWCLPDLIDAAQLCVSELVTNVITHVGMCTPASLAASVSSGHLRLEVRDPDTRALPTLVQAGLASESGRGIGLVDATASRWGVELRGDHKVTWCEIATGLPSTCLHAMDPRPAGVDELLTRYRARKAYLAVGASSGRVAAGVREEAAIGAIADILCWLHARGHDAADVLDRAEGQFEAAVEDVTRS